MRPTWPQQTTRRFSTLMRTAMKLAASNFRRRRSPCDAGWNFRNPSVGQPGELLPLIGSYIPLPLTREVAEQVHDPRLSITNRYGSRARYEALVTDRAEQLVAICCARTFKPGRIAGGALETALDLLSLAASRMGADLSGTGMVSDSR
jgi:hypothetical protein